MLAIALGGRGHTPPFPRTVYPGCRPSAELIVGRDERRLTPLQQRYQKVALLIVDELGFVPFEGAGGELLFNLLAQRYERRSTIITSNLTCSEWVKVFADETLTTALLDRLTHHAHILTIKGTQTVIARHRATTTLAAIPIGRSNGRLMPVIVLRRAPTAKNNGSRH